MVVVVVVGRSHLSHLIDVIIDMVFLRKKVIKCPLSLYEYDSMTMTLESRYKNHVQCPIIAYLKHSSIIHTNNNNITYEPSNNADTGTSTSTTKESNVPQL